jgi:hypothetical protein
MDEVLTSAPSLPSSLAYLYSKLSNEEQRVFHKVFNSMWCAVAPLKRFVHHGGVMYAYWIVDDLRMKADLSPVELSALMYLYHVSGGGRQIINAQAMYQSPSFPFSLSYWPQISMLFYRRGYVVRSSRNPAQPYTTGYNIKNGRKYMKLTDKAINLVRDMERELYRRVMSCTFNDIVCGYNKGQI